MSLFIGGNMTSIEKREFAYETEKIEFDGKQITVDEANKLWLFYYIEDDEEKHIELKELITNKKAEIRMRYSE